MKHKHKLSIVIPVFNGAATVGKLVELLKLELEKFELEIVLVNDHSPDNSEEVCKKIYEKHSDIVKFLSLAKNVGEHNAVMAGLNNTAGDFVVIIDDDFQNPPSEVEKLVEAAADGNFDVVYSYYDRKRDSLFRNLGSWFNNKVANIMLDKPKKLYLSSFKAMNRFLVDEIVKYESPFTYIDGLVLQVTDNIGTVLVEHQKREEGRSNYTLKKLVSLWLNMFTNFSIIPLRISIIFGFIVAFFGFVYGAFALIERILNPNLVTGWASLIVSISIFSGIQLIAIGSIGEYIGRIFLAQNKKPQFTVKKKYAKTGQRSGP